MKISETVRKCWIDWWSRNRQYWPQFQRRRDDVICGHGVKACSLLQQAVISGCFSYKISFNYCNSLVRLVQREKFQLIISLARFIKSCLAWSAAISSLAWPKFHLVLPIPIFPADHSRAAYSSPGWMLEYASLKRRSTCSRLHGSAAHKPVVLIFSTMDLYVTF